MTQPADREIIERWRRDPNGPMTLALCSALARRGEASPGTLHLPSVVEIGAAAEKRHGRDVAILVSVGRLYLAAGALEKALGVLVSAVRAGAQGSVYQLLGEILLRMGDARRAARMFEHLIHNGGADAAAVGWYTRALEYAALQDESGAEAVAGAIETALRGAEPRPAPAEIGEQDARRVPPPVASGLDARSRGLSAIDDEATDVVSMSDLISELARRRSSREEASAQDAVDFDLDRDGIAPDELVPSEPPAPAAPPQPPPREPPREHRHDSSAPVPVTSGKILPVALGNDPPARIAAVVPRAPPRTLPPAPMIAAGVRPPPRTALRWVTVAAALAVALGAAMVGLRLPPFEGLVLPWSSRATEDAPPAPELAPAGPATQAPAASGAPVPPPTGASPPAAAVATTSAASSASSAGAKKTPPRAGKPGATGKPSTEPGPSIPLWPGDPEAR